MPPLLAPLPVVLLGVVVAVDEAGVVHQLPRQAQAVRLDRPEPGGLDWRTVNAFVGRLAARRNVIGFDVVELLPHPAHWACDFLAAKLVHRVLAEILAAREI